MKKTSTISTFLFVLLAVMALSCSMFKQAKQKLEHEVAVSRLESSPDFPMIHLPKRYRIEKVVEGLTYPTSITWDDEGRRWPETGVIWRVTKIM